MTHRLRPIAVLLVLAAAGLAACARTGENILATEGAGYVADATQRTAGIDWTDAETVEVGLTEFDFQPEELVFQQGKPYRLILANYGSSLHRFTAEAFFKAVAVAALEEPGERIETPRLVSAAVPAGMRKDLLFVPVRKGRYPLECTVDFHAQLGMTGSIEIR